MKALVQALPSTPTPAPRSSVHAVVGSTPTASTMAIFFGRGVGGASRRGSFFFGLPFFPLPRRPRRRSPRPRLYSSTPP